MGSNNYAEVITDPIKAYFLIGPEAGAIQAEVAYSILNALNDGHLAELDAMVHDYKGAIGPASPSQPGCSNKV